MKRVVIISIMLAFSIFSIAQESKLSHFSRSFIDTHRHKNTDKELIRKNFAIKSVSTQEYVSAYLYLSTNTTNLAFLEDYGVIIDNTFDSILTVKIPVDQLEPLSHSDKVNYIEIGMPIVKKMSKARVAARVDQVQAGVDLSHPFLGKGVIVGVIDGGFQYNHINFYDAEDNYSTLRVKQVWDQANSKKYTTQSTIESAKYDNTSDDTGHGTHVTGIAAGGYLNNSHYGIAPQSDIIMVSYGSSNVDVTNAVKYIYDYATLVNKPAVVNMSLGIHQGPHDGTSTFDITCDNMQGAGRLLVGSAGNEGYMKLYREDFLSANQNSMDYITIEKGYDKQSFVDIWGDNDQNFTVQIVITTTSGDTVFTSQAYNATAMNSYSLTSMSYSAYATGNINIYTGKSRNSTNNKGNVLLYFNNFSLNTGYKVGVRLNAISAGTIRAWGSEYELYWANGSTTSTIGEIGGTGKKIITAGAYTTNARYTGSYLNRITYFSSKGPTTDGRLKPDITAPGDAIFASIPDLVSVVNNADGKISEKIGGKPYYWAYMSGTSMAAPFVTGVLSTWLEANPQLTPEKVREVFATTAITDTYTGACPNNIWGYGKINAYEGLLKVIATTPIQNLKTMPDAIMLYPNPNNGSFKLLFTESDENLTVTVYTANGQQILANLIDYITIQEELTMNLGTVRSGAYIVKITGKKINETLRLLVH